MPSKNTAAIDPQATYLTLINVYEVEPDWQAELAKALSESTENTIRHQPGFVSVCIHSSLDGTKVVNYAQWASKEHFEGFMKKPETQEQLKQFAALATSVAPSLYQVSAVHAA
ncbi:antibiotic biosynthesis monooxygenase [Verticiella sediminum]|uniref:Antibiotic biosynthesis monooxygenase n=1 Tax=Verticiella sediminum TaxID=1247510 RepID=A0A556AYM5_9BURK|nr:antibiotic biosynthesis monooxygenase family protein [Verticiella sediminum]TSH98028.1 antibiotic biosynthesis monooxygenase [Verticiella sediminum]